ncbi:hypothetical protein V565_022420 [Rhizoctonia solani 123E]|uniref:Uncharacterized protein n=1 Tax=Rhizoctonia solani 123E TaxID=1423351 RepID=A0A074S496_9AGAM|nr:hypothetical protein V565_022420 [Rhizoctonia solani 123E]
MAHTIDSRSHFNLYPTPISTSGLPEIPKPQYNYAYATPTSTPTKPYPSYYYHYRPATPPPRSIRRSFASAPNLCAAPSASPPPAARPSPLSVPPKSRSHPREIPRPYTPLPTPDPSRPVKREDEPSSSTWAQQHQENVDAQQWQARLIAERDATLKRIEERQRQAEEKTWYEESRRLAAEAAGKKEAEQRRRAEEDYRRAEEKLRRIAEAQAEEERKRRTHRQDRERERERGRPQARYPAADVNDKGRYREMSRDGRQKGEHGFEHEQRPERERAKSEAPESVKKDRARRSKSPSSVVTAWETYKEACTELMRAKPPKGKTSGRVTFYDIPWPILGQANSFHDLTNENIAAFLLSPHHSQDKNPKARLRAAILIWHPDKFAQKVSPHIAESHRPAVSAGVDIVARIVTELISSQSN